MRPSNTIVISHEALEEVLHLPYGQRLLRAWADPDPLRLWVVVEGGTEMPEWPDRWGPEGNCQTRMAAMGDKWPCPTGVRDPNVRRRVRVALDVYWLAEQLCVAWDDITNLIFNPSTGNVLVQLRSLGHVSGPVTLIRWLAEKQQVAPIT